LPVLLGFLIPSVAIISSSFISSAAATAESTNHLVLLGGGGDNPRDYGSSFDMPLMMLGRVYQKNEWGQVLMSFGAGQKATNQLIEKYFPDVKNTLFTSRSFETKLDEAERLMEQGLIAKGDQLLFAIATHGAPQYGFQVSHNISTAGIDEHQISSEPSLTTVNLDQLRRVQVTARRKGVKLAILDFTCFSGSTIELADDNTCVISSTGPTIIGYSDNQVSFPSHFYRGLGQGDNLETAFLKARARTSEESYPMISTQANSKITESEFRLINPYIYYTNIYDTLGPYLRKAADEKLSPQRDREFQELLQLISRVEAAHQVEFSKLKNKLVEFKRLQDEAITAMRRKDRQAEELAVATVREKSNTLALEIAKEEKRLYQLLYSEQQQANASPNACQSFVF
jgi:hypothetical protein